MESELAAKQASLPKEPLQNDEGAVTVVVRMPDGSRRGRRFLKSDKLQVSLFKLPESLLIAEVLHYASIILLELLQYLFDFIDISRTFKPGTYRLVILIYLLQCIFAKQYLLIKDMCSYSPYLIILEIWYQHQLVIHTLC